MSTQVNCVACDEIPGTISIHGSVLVSKMFLDITGLKAYQNYTICKACQHELRSCYNFRKRCHEIFNLYNPGATQTTSKSSKNRQSDSPPPQIFANPLGAAEITIVKNEMDRNTPAVTFHDEYHNEADDAMDSGDEYENTFQYEDINPQMSDDDDSNDSNEQEFGDDSSRFLCDECSKTFSKRSRLVAHKAEHRNERLYSCPRPGCNSAFNVPHRLTRHLRNVHDADEEEINQFYNASLWTCGRGKRRNTHTIAFKLEAIKYACETSNSKAAEHFGVHISQISRWKNCERAMKQKTQKEKKCIKRDRECKYPGLEMHLKSWITENRQNGRQVSGSEILDEARKLALTMGITDFRGSFAWLKKFKIRNALVRRSVTTNEQQLPDNWEEKMKEFCGFIEKYKSNYTLNNIGNMDEVPVAFDVPTKFSIKEPAYPGATQRILTGGNKKNRLIIILAVTSDGMKLPPYIIFRRKTIPKETATETYPKDVVIAANEKSHMTPAEMQSWHDKVWMKRAACIFSYNSILMLDSSPTHCSSDIKSKFIANGTVLAPIPDGMEGKLQPIDLGIAKCFKGKLRRRWQQWIIDGLRYGELRKPSSFEISEWISTAWRDVPVATVVGGFRQTTIAFYDEGSEENVKDLVQVGFEESFMESADDLAIREQLGDYLDDNFYSDVEEEFEF